MGFGRLYANTVSNRRESASITDVTSLKQRPHCAAAEADVAASQEARVRSNGGGSGGLELGGSPPVPMDGTQQNYSVRTTNNNFQPAGGCFYPLIDFYVSRNVKTATSCLRGRFFSQQRQAEKQQNEAKLQLNKSHDVKPNHPEQRTSNQTGSLCLASGAGARLTHANQRGRPRDAAQVWSVARVTLLTRAITLSLKTAHLICRPV